MTKHKQFEEYLFHDTYYFCHCVKNILCDQTSYIGGLNDFHGDGRVTSFSIAFPKYSHFHAFIEFIVSNIYYEELEWSNIQKLHKRFKELTQFELAMLSNSENGGVFSFFNKHQEYMGFLSSEGIALSQSDEYSLQAFLEHFMSNEVFVNHLEKTVDEVFYVLFANRLVVQLFNEMIASVREYDKDVFEDDSCCKPNGVLKRKNIPSWVKNAVFHRDKGVCVICKKDLTHLINNFNEANYDHIVPLSRYGINDISNIQLLCKECNQIDKNSKGNDSSYDYFPWYRMN